MFTGFSDYLKSTLGTNLSSFVQPDKITAATIFLVLNFIDLIFNASNFGGPINRLFSNFLNMNPIIQTGLILAFILMLAYLLLSFNNDITKIFTGESWTETHLGKWCIMHQKKRRERLIDASKRRDLASQKSNLTLVTSFTKQQAFVLPTALGNVQQATADYIWHHYGIDIVALLPHMQSIIDATDATLSTRVSNEKASLDFLLNMTFLLIVFAVELIMQSFVLFTQWTVLWAILPIALAVITYNGAISKARTWGDVLQVAFDMHRDDLRQKLGIRAFSSEDDERSTWQKVSSLLIWGDPVDDIFDIGKSASASATSSASSNSTSKTSSTTKQTGNSTSNGAASTSSGASSDKATVKTTANVSVEIQSFVIDERKDTEALKPLESFEITVPDVSAGDQRGWQIINQNINYYLVVSNNTKHDISNVFLYVTDPRIPVIYQKPQLKDIEQSLYSPAIASVSIVPESKNDAVNNQLLVHLTKLSAHHSLAICYQLPSDMFTVFTKNKNLKIDQGKAIATPCEETGAIDYAIVITNTDKNTNMQKAALEVFDSRKLSPDMPKYGCIWHKDEPKIVSAKKLLGPDRYLWELDSISSDEAVILTYSIKTEGKKN